MSIVTANFETFCCPSRSCQRARYSSGVFFAPTLPRTPSSSCGTWLTTTSSTFSTSCTTARSKSGTRTFRRSWPWPKGSGFAAFVKMTALPEERRPRRRTTSGVAARTRTGTSRRVRVLRRRHGGRRRTRRRRSVLGFATTTTTTTTCSSQKFLSKKSHIAGEPRTKWSSPEVTTTAR